MPTYFVDDLESFKLPSARSSAHLTILSEIVSGRDLTNMVGLPPDEQWDRGERPNAPGRFSGYQVDSRLDESESPAEHLRDLLSRIEPIANQLRGLVTGGRISSTRVWLVHRLPNWNPGLSIPAELIERLNEIGTGIEIDIYVTDPPAPIRGDVDEQ